MPDTHAAGRPRDRARPAGRAERAQRRQTASATATPTGSATATPTTAAGRRCRRGHRATPGRASATSASWTARALAARAGRRGAGSRQACRDCKSLPKEPIDVDAGECRAGDEQVAQGGEERVGVVGGRDGRGRTSASRRARSSVSGVKTAPALFLAIAVDVHVVDGEHPLAGLALPSWAARRPGLRRRRQPPPRPARVLSPSPSSRRRREGDGAADGSPRRAIWHDSAALARGSCRDSPSI